MDDRGLALREVLKLRKYATPTPAMTAMLARLDARFAERNATSPALPFARARGLGDLSTFWFQTLLSAKRHDGAYTPAYRVFVRFDSREQHWFLCALTELFVTGVRARTTTFDEARVSEDGFGFGRCDADGLPAWLKSAAATLHVDWIRPANTESIVKWDGRARILDWLLGPRA